MSTTKAARPVKAPARAKVVRAVRKKPVKKTPAKTATTKVAKKADAKKVVATKAVPKTTVAKKAVINSGAPTAPSARTTAGKTADSVRARRNTMDKTLRFPGCDEMVTEADDHAANRKFKRIRRATAVDKLNHPPPAAGAALIERVSRAVERELLQIETIVGGHRVQPGQRTEAERRARTLASLARTLAEVRRLRAAEQPQRPADGPSVARDLEAFRRVLWKRLEGMVGRTTPFPADGNE